jgi:hypothetical protein
VDKVTRWLLAPDSDPAIRWQTLRDLTDESRRSIASERSRVASEGWGAQLLALQSPKGYWGTQNDEGWMTTVYTLTLLKEFGVDPDNKQVSKAIKRVTAHLKWRPLKNRPFFDGETEPCINGRILGAGAYFGTASEPLVARLLEEQLPDGGWNCDAPKSRRSSFHTTICVLEGLLAYEQATRGAYRRNTPTAVTRARKRAHEYLMERRLLRSLSTGEIIDRHWTRFAFPTTWHYDVLRGLDYLRSANVKPEPRLEEAINIVNARRHQNGRWPLNTVHPNLKTPPLEPGKGRASRWNTLRSLRVLKWYEG